MRILFIILFIMSVIFSAFTSFATGHPRTYPCSKVGVSKVKPFKFKKTRAAKPTIKSNSPRFRPSED